MTRAEVVDELKDKQDTQTEIDMSLCDRCVLNMEDCHDASPVFQVVQNVIKWKKSVTDDLTKVPDWAEGCPGFEEQHTKPFATPEEVRQHRYEEECLDELVEKAVDYGRISR